MGMWKKVVTQTLTSP